MNKKFQLDHISQILVQNYRQIYGDAIVRILLYGSYARHEECDDSDIDVVAIVNGDREELQKKLNQMWDIVSDIGMENYVVISPTVVPYDEFEKYKNVLPYYMNIEKEGKLIG